MFIVLGVLFVLLRHTIARSSVGLYRKIGIDVPVETYARQFLFIGVLLMVVGFLGVTGLLQFL